MSCSAEEKASEEYYKGIEKRLNDMEGTIKALVQRNQNLLYRIQQLEEKIQEMQK